MQQRSAPAQLLAVGSGKGGVGKSFLVSNLGVLLAREGHRTVVVDADLEGANLHTWLGLPQPHRSLADFVARREEDVEKLLMDTAAPNLQLIAATHSNLVSPQPGHARRVQLARALRQLDADFVILDLGAGTQAAVIDYFMVADAGVVVVAPEPTSVENAYAFIRAAFYRRLHLAMISHEMRKVVATAMDQRNERGIRTPLDLLREIRSVDPEEGERFSETVRAFQPQIVVNEARTAEDVRLGFSITSVCRKYFGIEAQYIGYVNYDPAARQSVRERRVLVDTHPRSDAAVYLTRIARKLAALRAPNERSTAP